MTYIFDMQLGKVQIVTDMPEWRERFPNVGEGSSRTLDIVDGWRSGWRKMLAEEMLKELVADKPRKSWPDAFTTRSGLHIVSERANDVIERFDPDLHQFFPLRLRTKRKVEIVGPWFAMNVTVRQNSIVVEKSHVLVSKKYPDKLCSFFCDTRPGGFIVDAARLSPSIHFWREARFEGSLLGSYALVDALKAGGLKFFPSYRATALAEVKNG